MVPHPKFIARWTETPEVLAQRRELRELLDHALNQLDDRYRVVFVLRDLENLSTEATAEILSLSQSNVKVRLLRARLQLREWLTRELGDADHPIVPDHSHQ